MDKRSYVILGRGERLVDGLGELISDLGCAVQGREVSADFLRLRFAEQLALICSDLQPGFWQPGAVLVGYSYGAFLLLQTLADMDPFPGRILLFSPVLGAAVARNGLFGSRPPRAERLLKLAEGGNFPAPRYLEAHTGADDNGCDPGLAARFCSLVSNATLHVVSGAGHRLGDEYIQERLRRFLISS